MDVINRGVQVRSMASIRPAHLNATRQHMTEELKQKVFQHSGYASGRVVLQRIGSAPDSSPSIVLRTPLQSYLFNCGEGTERALASCGGSLGFVSQVFLTQTHWGTLGGIDVLMKRTAEKYGSMPHFHGFDDIFTYIRRIRYLSKHDVNTITTTRPDIVNETGFYEDTDVRIVKMAVANAKGDGNNIAFSYLCKVKALQGMLVSSQNYMNAASLHRHDGKINSDKSAMVHLRYPDRPEINFMGNIY